MSNYSIGLDIGTNSVGWAVVDENNNIVKKNNFNMWGVRMFEEANDASERRSYRASRRRLARRNQRIKLLRNLFNDEINKTDQNFFQRLDDSFFKVEDKENLNKYTFFDDEMTDKEYFEKYPTIYHLRNDLMTTNEKKDIRLVYLAIHHIIKYRGNFLQDGEVFNKNDKEKLIDDFKKINELLINIREEFEDDSDYFDTIDKVDCENFLFDLESIINEKNGKREKKENLIKFFNCEKTSFVNEFIVPLLVNSPINASALKVIKDLKYDKVEIDLTSEELDSKIEEAKKNIVELSSLFDIAYFVKDINDYFYLVKLLGTNNSLSEAMVEIYENHQNDLKLLKKFIKTYCKTYYNECFRMHNDKDNYCSYIGMVSTNGEIKRFKHCAKEKFYAYIKSIIEKVSDKEAEVLKNEILNKIDNNEFLLRQNSGQNSSIPMQLHLIELRKILEKQSKYYPFLNEVSDNYSTKEKIELIFKFKIPYYVGPLNNKSNKSWVIRSKEKIYPWNFDNIVNIDESAKKFIERMQNKCTYLHGIDDYCLPKKSLIFSEYNCLQYLNKITIDNKTLDYKTKMDLFNNIFCSTNRPTRKRIEEYLKTNYGVSCDRFTSKIDDVTCDMSSYITFKNIFGKDFNNKKEIIEEIIKDITIFEDKKILVKRLKEVYKLDDDKISQIKSLNYKGYGSLCKKLLTELTYVNPKTGEVFGPIIQIMRDTNMNLQEILYNQEHPFINVIDKYNKGINDKNTKLSIEEYIDEYLYISPNFKRPMIQAYKIIEEVETILKTKISKFYVECTRTNKAEKVKKLSRYESVKELLKNCKIYSSQLNTYNIDINHLNTILESNKESLRSDKIYLYLTQLGKDLYTMENIDLDQVISGTYDIDHIYPQSLIKDDSLSNRVLVNKHFNEKVKSNKFLYEVSSSLPKNRIGFYQLLLDSKLITKEKFRRLTENEITKDKLDTFVNRQLVATNQAVKGIITLLKEYKGIDSNDIIYSKSENISDFRKEYDINKSRTANNYHHAHDAYLNVVVGGALDNYYKNFRFNNYSDYVRLKAYNASTNPMIILSKDRIYNNKVIWKKEETVKLLKENIFNNFDIHETTRTYTPNVMFSKVSILPAPNGTVSIKNDKRGNIEKYGGITSGAYSKYVIVKGLTKKGKTEYILEAILKNNANNLKVYLDNLYKEKYTEYEIINDCIKVNQVIEKDKLKYCITGVESGGASYLLKNQKDRNLDKECIRIIKNIDKYFLLKKYNVDIDYFEDRVVLSRKTEKGNEVSILLKDCDYLKNYIIQLYNKDVFKYGVTQSILTNIDKINNLGLVDRISVLYNILGLLKTNERNLADLTLIGLAKKSGKLSMTKNLKEGTKFISQSITGYYKKVIFKVPNVI